MLQPAGTRAQPEIVESLRSIARGLTVPPESRETEQALLGGDGHLPSLVLRLDRRRAQHFSIPNVE